MTVLGVTGGIGSGKTTVCRMFEALGARAFYADTEAKKLMVSPAIRAEIEDAFGKDSYDGEGQLNRAYLAQHVFGDAAQLARINQIVHPRVFEALEAAIQQAKSEEIQLLVYESALIFNGGRAAFLDAVLVVDAPPSTRVGRVTARDKITPERVNARMQHQRSSQEMRQRADYIIINDGSLEALTQQVHTLYQSLVA